MDKREIRREVNKVERRLAKAGLPRIDREELELFYANVEPCPCTTDCLHWKGETDIDTGQGIFRRPNKPPIWAQTWIWHVNNGPPDDEFPRNKNSRCMNAGEIKLEVEDVERRIEEAGLPKVDRADLELAFSQVDSESGEKTGCLIWRGEEDVSGDGIFRRPGKPPVYIHWWFYSILHKQEEAARVQ